MKSKVKQFTVGKDFTEEEFDKWESLLRRWCLQSMSQIKTDGQARKYVAKVLSCALDGTTITGKKRQKAPGTFAARIRQSVGYDLDKEVGIYRKHSGGRPQTKIREVPSEDIQVIAEQQKAYKQELMEKYPHLNNSVHEPKVDELAETIIKSRMMSSEFLRAKGNELDKLSKIRESLHKQTGSLLDHLQISPKFLVAKEREADKSDLGSLISKVETFGEAWQQYELLDSLRELLQKYKQLNTRRPDGTPQLNDWELWHMTRNRPVKFKCRCGEEYNLLGGFTPEEIEQALVQAEKVYGFGLKGIEGNTEDQGIITEQVLTDHALQTHRDNFLEEDKTDSTQESPS